MSEATRQAIMKDCDAAGIDYDENITCANASYWLKKAAEACNLEP